MIGKLGKRTYAFRFCLVLVRSHTFKFLRRALFIEIQFLLCWEEQRIIMPYFYGATRSNKVT